MHTAVATSLGLSVSARAAVGRGPARPIVSVRADGMDSERPGRLGRGVGLNETRVRERAPVRLALSLAGAASAVLVRDEGEVGDDR
jgi:hypothetical protein